MNSTSHINRHHRSQVVFQNQSYLNDHLPPLQNQILKYQLVEIRSVEVESANSAKEVHRAVK